MGVVPYVLLVVSAFLTVAVGPPESQSPADRLVTLGVAGLAAAWMLWMVSLHPGWARRRGPMAVYVVGLLALIAVLVSRGPWFGLFAFTGYLHAWEFLSGRWRLAGVTAAAALHVTAIFGGRPPEPTLPAVAAFIVLVVVIAAMAIAFSYWGMSSASRVSSVSG
jgi:hypothetical protein